MDIITRTSSSFHENDSYKTMLLITAPVDYRPLATLLSTSRALAEVAEVRFCKYQERAEQLLGALAASCAGCILYALSSPTSLGE
jgi:hypothetical protein